MSKQFKVGDLVKVRQAYESLLGRGHLYEVIREGPILHLKDLEAGGVFYRTAFVMTHASPLELLGRQGE